MDLDTLWQLAKARKRSPHWNPIYVDRSALRTPSNSDYAVSRILKTPATGSKVQPKLLDSTADEDMYHDLPGLESASDSSEAYSDTDSSASEVEDEDAVEEDGEDSEEEYDTDAEEELRQLERAAIDLTISSPDILNEILQDKGDQYADERKKNPFLELMGSLRGIFFSPRHHLGVYLSTR